MSCPPDEVVVRYVEGDLPPAQRQAFQRHLSECATCAELVGEAANDLGTGQPTARFGHEASVDGTLVHLNAGSSASQLPRGSVIGRYIVLEEIGAGGLGRVYAAYDPQLDRRVALKVLKGAADDEASLRLLREAQAMAKLSHPHVVSVYDSGVAGGRAFIAMQLVEGGTLRDWIANGDRSPSAVRDIYVQAGLGLAAAHAQNLVHRDFKPTNVLIDRTERAMVTDFGLATPHELTPVAAPRPDQLQRPHQDLLGVPMTEEGLVMGTPGYFAPEQLVGHKADARSDQFSFCVSLFAALHGQRPFPAAQGAEAYLRAIRDPAQLKAKRRGKVPAWMDAAVLRGLSWDPAARYSSIDALLTALNVDRRKRRRAGVMAAALAAVVAVGGGLTAWLYEPATTVAERSELDRLVDAAHLAASRAYFVFPPRAEPDFMTSYRAVVSLEARGTEGLQRATRLREEFATTLFRLGNEYWDRAGGRAFATDYYAAGLIFSPNDERGRDRLLVTPGQLAVLQQKATSGQFSTAERAAAEPLAALAEPDPARRSRRIRQLGQDPELPSTTRAALQAFGDPPSPAVTPPAARPRPEPESPPTEPGSTSDAPDGSDTAAEPDSSTGTETDTDTETETDTSENRLRAAAETKAGHEAIAANRMADAERHFHRALRLQRTLHSALAGLSQVHFENRKYTKAAEFGERAVRSRPKHGRYRIMLGDAYLRSLKYQAAETQYLRAQALSEPRAAKRLATLRARMGHGDSD